MARQVEHALSPPALTERQRQVASGVARGLTNDEIGAELGISPRTVKAHCDTLRLTDGALWITVTREGTTLTWQHGGERFQLDQPGANLTEGLFVVLDRAEELLRLDVEEERIQSRRHEIGRELA